MTEKQSRVAHAVLMLMVLTPVVGLYALSDNIQRDRPGCVSSYPRFCAPEGLIICAQSIYQFGQPNRACFSSACEGGPFLSLAAVGPAARTVHCGPWMSALRKTGTIGLEFVGSGVSSSLVALGAYAYPALRGQEEFKFSEMFIRAAVGNLLLTSTCAWGLGRLAHERTVWWHSAAGVAVGCLAAIPLVNRLSQRPVSSAPAWLVGILFPAIGATLGCNF